MENNLILFRNEEFGSIRSLKIDDEPWFVAKDVCEMLDIKNPTQAVGRLDKDERTILNIGRQGRTNFVNEYGLYNLILASRKPEARAVKRWITHDVIPAIMKNGNYDFDSQDLMKRLAESQINTNALLVGFKAQIDSGFQKTNDKLSEHDELLRKRVYLSTKEAKDVQDAIKNKAKQIAVDNALDYYEVRSSLFKRLYTKLNDKFEVASYRELPSVEFEKILNTIKNLKICTKDLKEENNSQFKITIQQVRKE